MGELVPATPEHPHPTTHKVKSFTEKPDRDFARMFMDSGEFLWNTGTYMAKAQYISDQLTSLIGDVTIDYSTSPNLSIDMAILEKMPERVVMECAFGWADIGAWHGIYEAFANADVDNVVVNKKSNLMVENATHTPDCLVYYPYEGIAACTMPSIDMWKPSERAKEMSDSFQDDLLSPPVYTRPADYNGWKVPEVLLSGNPRMIREWQDQQALERTKLLRPELLTKS